MLILLISTRRYFDVAAPAKTYRRLGVAIVALLGILAVIYVGGGMLARHGFDIDTFHAQATGAQR